MKILFIGDVVGSPGRSMVQTYLKKLKEKYKADLTIVNGENAAGGRGITKKIYQQFLEAGADIITLGNHTWDNKEIFDFIDDAKFMVRPANFPEETPGYGYVIHKVNKTRVCIINIQGRTFLPPIDCPFKKVNEIMEKESKNADIFFVDFHAEATSEKQAMGWFLDGKASAVVGTHTHVQTADNRILSKGTAYITDVGMTGPYDGILGIDQETIIKRFLTSLPVRFEVSKGREQLSGVIIDINNSTAKANSIKRVVINDDEPFLDGF